MALKGAQQEIQSEVERWDSVEVHTHRFGGIEFRLRKRELGHIHGDFLVDIPFPMKVRNELVELHEVEPHHVLQNSGWVSFHIRSSGDVTKAISLLRRSYEIALQQAKR